MFKVFKYYSVSDLELLSFTVSGEGFNKCILYCIQIKFTYSKMILLSSALVVQFVVLNPKSN